MKSLKWWLRIVGTLYLLEGGGLSLMAFFDPDQFAATWASAPVGSLDEIASRGILIAGLPGVLSWVLFGGAMWFLSRMPARAGVLVVIVALWELVVWSPADLVGLSHGFSAPRAFSLLAIHVAIGVSGLLLVRRTSTAAA